MQCCMNGIFPDWETAQKKIAKIEPLEDVFNSVKLVTRNLTKRERAAFVTLLLDVIYPMKM